MGAAFDGLHGFLVGIAAGATSKAAEAAVTFATARARRSAMGAQVQHAVLFADAEPGETTEQRRLRVLHRRMGE